MCPHGHGFASNVPDMTKETALTISDNLYFLQFTGRVVIAGTGEPLLHKNAVELIALIGNKLDPVCEFNLVTNGDFLTIELIKKLTEAGITRIMVSLHDGVEQVEHFTKLFAEANYTTYTLRAHWDKDASIFTNRCGYVSATPNEPIKKVCHYPFYHIEIRSDGELVLCSQDWSRQEKRFNINTSALGTTWIDSGWLNEYRKKLMCANREMTPCNKCNVPGDLYGAASFKVWADYIKENTLVY